MSVTIKCINDKDKPIEVDKTEWVKEGNEYELIFVSWHPNQKCNGCQLAEIALTEKSIPFEFYKLNRFQIKLDDLEKFLKLTKDCSDLNNLDLNTLLKETEIKVENY